MKKIYGFISAFLVLGLGLLLILNSCNKTEQNEMQDQQSTVQTDFNTGCLFLPEDIYAQIPLAKDPEIARKGVTAIVNLNCPSVGDQGSEGSCVAWGTTYAGRSIDWQSIHGGNYSNSTNVFSPEYVYNQIKVGDCASGSYVTDGLNLLKSQGVCVWNTMPYSDKNGCSTLPTAAQKAEAANYKIAGYSRVSISSTAIKAQLDAGNAVIVAGPVNNAFVSLGSNKVLTTFKKPSLGGHCYCVVGYDDTKSAFKFINSWGTSWATAGYGYISYSNVKNWWQEAYVIN